MLRCSHEPHHCFSRIDGRTAVRFAAPVALPLRTFGSATKSVLDLGIGGWHFVGGGQRGGRSPLHQCLSLGATVPGLGSQGVDGWHPLGTPVRLRYRSHYRDSEGGDGPAPRSGAGIHHLVSAQVGGVPAAATHLETLGSFYDPPTPARSRLALPSRSNLVPESRPRFRGKKNQ